MMTDCVYWHHPIGTNHNQIIGHDVTCTLNMSYEDPKRDIQTRYMEARYVDPFKCDLEIIAPRKRELEILTNGQTVMNGIYLGHGMS